MAKVRKLRRSFEAGFKLEAITLAQEISNRKAAFELGINESMIRKWRLMEPQLAGCSKAKRAFRGYTRANPKWPRRQSGAAAAAAATSKPTLDCERVRNTRLIESEVGPSEGDSWKYGDASSTFDVLRMPATAAESESLQYELESPDQQNEQPHRGSKATDAVIGETGLRGKRPRKPSNWEMPYQKKRRRKIAQRQPLYMSLEREIVDVWNSIGEDEGLLSDADIANFLISLYRHGKASEEAGDIAARIIPLGGVCSHCQGLLTLTVSCNTCQIIHGQSQLEKRTACNTSGSQLEKENTPDAFSLQLYPESPVFEQVNPLVLTCEKSDTSQGLSQTLESSQPLHSRLISHQPECSQPSPVFETILEMESIKGKTEHRLRAPEMPVVRSQTAFDLQHLDIVEIKTEPELYNDSDVPDFTEAFPVRIANSKAEKLKESDHCEALENTAESVLDCMPIEALETQVVRQEEKELESESNLQRMLIKVVECSDEESVS